MAQGKSFTHECKEWDNQKLIAYGNYMNVRHDEEHGWVISAEEEYESTISYCPFCGIKLESISEKQIE